MTQAIVLDIEGTTTPLSFVHDILFPFAKDRIAGFVAQNFAELRNEIEGLAAEAAEDSKYSRQFDPVDPESVSEYLVYLIGEDSKSTPLKSIQGRIWQQGYEAGELTSSVFTDVRPGFERWNAAGITIAIFSSGSVLAQRLLFKYTEQGDLTPFISSYFDTEVGRKQSSRSYLNIARELDLKPAGILFVSDVVAELDAARLSGMQTALCIRPGNPPVEDGSEHRTITTFDDLE